MGVGAPNAVIEAPFAEAPLFGLIESSPFVTRSTDAGASWIKGVQYSPEGCKEGDTVAMCETGTFSFTDRPDEVRWEPYILTAEEVCTASTYREDRLARGRRLLEQDTERQLAYELWTGDLAQATTLPDGDAMEDHNTWLARNPDVDILSHSGPVSLIHGLACLEQYLANNNGGRRGMIHATVQTVTHWDSYNLLDYSTGQPRTRRGNIVVTSPGYPGTSPDGEVSTDNVWAYATDIVRVYLGPVRVEEAEDRDNDDIAVFANRPALAEWERCRHAGVRLAVSVCDEGGS